MQYFNDATTDDKEAYVKFNNTKKDCYIQYDTLRDKFWYRLYNLKNVKTTHGGVLILVKF